MRKKRAKSPKPRWQLCEARLRHDFKLNANVTLQTLSRNNVYHVQHLLECQHFLIIVKHKVQLLMLQLFSHKLCINWSCDPTMGKSERIINVRRIHRLETADVCTKCYLKSPMSCFTYSFKRHLSQRSKWWTDRSCSHMRLKAEQQRWIRNPIVTLHQHVHVCVFRLLFFYVTGFPLNWWQINTCMRILWVSK